MDFLMEKERFEELLNELLDTELEHSRRVEILQELRVAQNNTYQGVEELTKRAEKLQRDNDDLVISNSKLFRQLGSNNEEEKEVVEQKEFSETITLEQLEGSVI